MDKRRFMQRASRHLFKRVYDRWKQKKLTQKEAAELLGITQRTLRRYIVRYRDEGIKGLLDRRMVSPKRAPQREISEVVALYRGLYPDRSVAHFYEAYVENHGGKRSYSWVKRCLYRAGLGIRPRGGGSCHRRGGRREQVGLMIHQDVSTHEWVLGKKWDLVVTMDDATGEIYSAFFVAQEGTQSSFRGVRDVLEREGIFASFYSDRGSHYWNTPVAGGRVDKENPTQFGRAMMELGILMISRYSPEARGRSEKMFKTLQGWLCTELSELGIVEMDEANRFLGNKLVGDFNRRFMVAPAEEGSAFVPLFDVKLDDILCLKHPKVVGNDNCVSYKGMRLQIPPVEDRYHFVRARVMVHEYSDGSMAIYHERCRLGSYDSEGRLKNEGETSGTKARVGGHRSFTPASRGVAKTG